MMTHPDEHSIEMYVLKPDGIDAESRLRLQDHFSLCPGCAAIERALRAFYSDLAKSPEANSTSVARATNKIFSRATIIPLPPFHPRSQNASGQSYSGVLAAMTGPKGVPAGFETVATFASESEHILVRIRQDAANRRVRVYFHAEDPRKSEGIILSLPYLSAEILVDTRVHMEFEISEPRTTREWAALDAHAAFPLDTVEIEAPSEGNSSSEQVPLGDMSFYEVTLVNADGMINVYVESFGNAPHVRRVVVKDESGKARLVKLCEGHGIVPAPARGGRLHIRLYL